jgi:peroxiredoxin
MVATLCLLGCVLAPGQTADRPNAPPAPQAPRGGDWLLVPRLGRAQELVYRGSFQEEASGGGVQFSRAYRVEMRAFVLDTPPRGASVAFLTVLKHRDPRPATPPPVSTEPVAGSVRLERAFVTLQGKVTPEPGVSLAVPLEGAPTIECGAFVDVPEGRVGVDHTWDVAEEGRPVRTWRVAGTEMVNGTSCLKLVGVQQSEDWDRPRADRTAWRRQDTAWVAPRLGIAYRVERRIERREPARREPNQRSLLRYELESSLQYPGPLGDDRAQEITRALAFRDSAAPLLPTPARYGPRLAALLNKITYHLEHQPPTPYREAVLQLKRRVEAARRGEVPPAPTPDEAPRAPAVAAVGARAPDFAVSDFTGPEPAHLRRWLGRPILLLFYKPSSPTSAEVLRYAQRLGTGHGRGLTVLGMSVDDDVTLVRKQRTDLGLTFPVLSGSGLRTSYAVEATPRFVLLDAAGIVRGTYLGWGQATPGEIEEELRRWLPPR